MRDFYSSLLHRRVGVEGAIAIPHGIPNTKNQRQEALGLLLVPYLGISSTRYALKKWYQGGKRLEIRMEQKEKNDIATKVRGIDWSGIEEGVPSEEAATEGTER